MLWKLVFKVNQFRQELRYLFTLHRTAWHALNSSPQRIFTVKCENSSCHEEFVHQVRWLKKSRQRDRLHSAHSLVLGVQWHSQQTERLYSALAVLNIRWLFLLYYTRKYWVCRLQSLQREKESDSFHSIFRALKIHEKSM